MTRHLQSLFDLSSEEVREILQLAGELKSEFQQGIRIPRLPGRTIALLFEKPSLRTRVSFEAGMAHLGGHCLFLGPDVGWGERESVEDFARVLSRYVDAIICRAKAHDRVANLAEHATCPVINGLTDSFHPCQALTDLFTIAEHHGDLEGRTITFVGDGNNVARSLALGCAKLGLEFRLAGPSAYHFDADFLDSIRRQQPDARVLMTTDVQQAMVDADAVYTDVWASMGQEAEQEERKTSFAPFQVNGALMALAPPSACFLHCLPARRGEEVTDEVMEGVQSRVFDQAENRMHVQKALLVWLLQPQA